MPTWTRVGGPADLDLLPAWFIGRMTGGPAGSFGLLLTTGDVLRVASIAAAHLSSDGIVLLDVRLDHAGVPEGVDTAWRSKHYLGTPAHGAASATVSLAQVVAAVEFAAPADAPPTGVGGSAAEGATAAVGELRQVAEHAARSGTID
jgi:hypothetical protein